MEIPQVSQCRKASIIRVIWPVLSICMILMTLLLIPCDLGMLAILTTALCMVLFFITGQCRYLIASGPGIATAGIITDQSVAQARERISIIARNQGDSFSKCFMKN
ncbi:MAG TPA: hypothetical protein DD687_05000 [Verrucomicrobiales bacterium]|nr:hypothetical protein [Verrucomicrobiales bacterium]